MLPHRYDDYDYAEVNQLLERMLKVYIKTVTCYPEKTNLEMFDRFWKQFKHSEKVGQPAPGSDQLQWGQEWAGAAGWGALGSVQETFEPPNQSEADGGGKWKLAVCKEMGLAWCGTARSVMSTAATGSVGISQGHYPGECLQASPRSSYNLLEWLLSAAGTVLVPARRAGAKCAGDSPAHSSGRQPQPAGLGGEGERAAVSAGKLGGILSHAKRLTSLGGRLLALLPTAHCSCLKLSCFSLRST